MTWLRRHRCRKNLLLVTFLPGQQLGKYVCIFFLFGDMQRETQSFAVRHFVPKQP